jgi:hypothetical protein
MLRASIKKTVSVVGLLSLMSHGALAKVSIEDALRLGKDLTPIGAEKAGNAAGTIPEWVPDKLKIPEGHNPGDHHPDVFADDPILFTITAANLDQYRGNLTEGQIKLFETYPDTFKMNVYPTRRTTVYPDWVNERTQKCATTASLGADGNEIVGAHACVPFPIPQNGNEVVWNHMLRYQGIFRVEALNQAAPDAKGRYVTDKVTRATYWPYWDVDRSDDNRLSMFIPRQLAPARVAGDTFLIIDYLNPAKNPRGAWRYFGGQRRVRRAPVFVFDTPIPPSQGLRTTDTYDLFFGSPEKYQWNLLGKQEKYIGYNAYKMSEQGRKDVDIVKVGHIDAELPRYELHRVWVVEAKLKEGQRHIYPRRMMYFDEDSWAAHIADLYDERGELWRTAHLYSKYFWHPQLLSSANVVHHDLVSRRYNVVALLGEYDKTYDYSKPAPGDGYFTPANIRKMGVR